MGFIVGEMGNNFLVQTIKGTGLVKKTKIKIIANDEYAKGGMMDKENILKEDDYVWNAVGKKLVVNKVTKDEYYLSGFGQIGASPFSKSKVK
jgi:hypothetical protein